MKKGFLLSKPAQKTAETSSTTKVTPTTALKSIPSNRFHNVITDFMLRLIDRSSAFLLSSIIPTDPEVMEMFFIAHEDKVIPLEQLAQLIDNAGCSPYLAQFLATILNIFLLDDENLEIFTIDSEIR
ncbi:hypothetical protein RclHR1_25140002 [Rhizophagus clarus]|uniref:Uncharacterized protein n=1 Tax=Rhizophagus clarus TaxID=94130 RepID=A0A2Z6R0C0_9GLOM|nr:hypothetical protein RclHR1_25140002 [Rhizophagus clarus]GES94312.1 hypothetical protein RCL_e10840_RclHR1_25140002 [Rhizophagus clarus]